MTYFTDSVYEKMMTQKPRYGRENHSPTSIDKDKSNDKGEDKNNKSKPNQEVILIPKKRSVKK